MRGATLSPDGRLVANADIGEGEEVVALPAHLVLSYRSVDPRMDSASVLGRAIDAHPKLFPLRLIMPLWLCYERHRPDSLWRPYLTSLPSKFDMPVHWKKAQLAQLSRPLAASTRKDQGALRRDYNDSLAQLCALYPELGQRTCDFATWRWAWSVVWSRGVSVELSPPTGTAEEGPLEATALTPFADMANHAGPKHANAVSEWDRSRSAWVIRSVAPIPSGAEVLVSYGGGAAGNAELLRRFGFTEPRSLLADSCSLTLSLGKEEGRDEARAVAMGRRALNRALFDAVEDRHELVLFAPDTAQGRAALHQLLLHSAVRVVPDPASLLDSFAEGGQVAARVQTELDGDPALAAAALEHALSIVERGLAEDADEERAAKLVAGRARFCDPAGPMRGACAFHPRAAVLRC